ncbi:MAG TPA: hypothetical protein VFZ54_00725 [Burkholderiales bacterium]
MRHALGEFEYARNSSGVLIAAPHGSFDANTAPIAIQAARELQASHLVAWRFVVDKVRLNVNRPTEGAFLPCAQEQPTDRAREVFETYAKLAGNPERLYVEIHGNSNPNTARSIEVATVGITAAQAQALKADYPEMLRQSGLPDLGFLIEPVDRITYCAACAKKLGTLGQAPRALHFEFPRSARETTNLSRTARLVSMIVRRLLEL